MSAAADKFASLKAEISELRKVDSKKFLPNFKNCIARIKAAQCTKEEYVNLFESLEISLSLYFVPKLAAPLNNVDQSLLLLFFEEFALLRKDHKNLVSEKRLENFARLISAIDVTKLSPQEISRLVKNLDQIGFGIAPDFSKSDLPAKLVNQALNSFQNSFYKGEQWTKNVMHFLAHCKNLGWLKQSQENPLLHSILHSASNFITEHEGNIDFSEIDAQASFDVLLYAEYVLENKSFEGAQAVVMPLLSSSTDFSSKAHHQVFARIKDFLMNQKEVSDQWSHVPEAKQNKIIYGGVVSIGIEEPYLEINGKTAKRGDIVVRNLINGEIIFLIEVDGLPHFLTDKIKTGKTRARDELAKEILGEERFITIDKHNFDFFRRLRQGNTESKSQETEFLHKIQNIIQSELQKTHQATTIHKEKPPEVLTQTTALETSPKTLSSSPPNKAARQEDPRKSTYEIRENLKRIFWKILEDPKAGNIEEILSDSNFAPIIKQDLCNSKNGLNPFDYLLDRFNLSADQKEKDLFSDMLKILWIYGFSNQNKKLIKEKITYPTQLHRALDLETKALTINIEEALRNARHGKFHLINIALERDNLPSEVAESDTENFSQLLRYALLNQKHSKLLLSTMQQQSWFKEIEGKVFIKAVENSDDAIALNFLFRKKELGKFFFREIFTKHGDLMPKIYDFQYSLTTELLEQELKKFDLVKSSETLFRKAYAYAFGSGVSRDLAKAAHLLQTIKEPRKGSNEIEIKLHREAQLFLADIYIEQGESHCTKAAKIYERYLKFDVDGSINFALSEFIFFDKEKRLGFLKAAADLKHPTAMGLYGASFLDDAIENGSLERVTQAVNLFKEGVKGKDIESLVCLGNVYLRGIIKMPTKEEGDQKAFELFKEAMQKGSASGALNLAECYELGVGTQKDLREAKKYYNIAVLGLHGEQFIQKAEESIKRINRSLIKSQKEGLHLQGEGKLRAFKVANTHRSENEL
jgi:TPR repeat protein